MATYKEIKGVTVQTRDEDPVVAGGSWSSGGSLNTSRYGLGSAGTLTAGSVFAGWDGSSSVANHEYYDGTSFTEQTDINTAREGVFGAGTQTASIVAAGDSGGGNYKTETETWQGSAWTEVSELNTARSSITSIGHTNTAAIAVGGSVGGNPPVNSAVDPGVGYRPAS